MSDRLINASMCRFYYMQWLDDGDLNIWLNVHLHVEDMQRKTQCHNYYIYKLITLSSYIGFFTIIHITINTDISKINTQT